MKDIVYKECRKLFREAKALPPEAWPVFIQEHCGGNAELADTLAKLLEAGRRPDPLLALVDSAPFPKTIGVWQIVDEIGNGGAGVVFRARRLRAPEGGIIALKILRPDRLTSDAVARFQNERSVLTSLKHPNIVRILDSGVSPALLPYLAMEFVDGVGIVDYGRRLRLTLRQRVGLFRQVCVAVQFLHDYGVLHRDLTPNNLMVLADGLVKVVDFGISKSFGLETAPASTIGLRRMMTPAYASPEQLRQEHLTPQSDIYSMGVVLYELLTGALPFDPLDAGRKDHGGRPGRYRKASERFAKRAMPVAGFPETGSQAHQLLHGSLDNILRKALEQDPRRRYPTAELFRIDLSRYLEGLDTLADREGRFRWWRR